MTTCDDTHRWLARLADEGEASPDTAVARAHVAVCAACRVALAEQRQVADILRRRPALAPSPWFAARVAARLEQGRGWLGILDWRAWTFRLAPVALLLLGAVVFGASTTSTESPASTATTLEAWTLSGPESSSTSAALWADSSADVLLETLLIGPDRVQPEEGHAR